MNNPSKDIADKLSKDIHAELKFSRQFAISFGALMKAKVDDLPPYLGPLKIHIIEAFWSMALVRIMNFFEDGASSLRRFIQHQFILKKITSERRAELIARLERLEKSDDMIKIADMRDKVIAHSDRKKPAEHQLIFLVPVLNELLAIFVAAGGPQLDVMDLEKNLNDAWKNLFDLVRLGLKRGPKPSFD